MAGVLPTVIRATFEKAIADYTEAIRLNPKYANAYCNRGATYRHKGELDKAIADYTEAIRLDPSRSEAYNNRGVAYEQMGEKAKAEEDFAKAKKLGHMPRPSSKKHGDGLSNPWLGFLILGAAICLVLYWIVRKRRLLAYSEKGDKAKADEDFAQAKKLGYKAK